LQGVHPSREHLSIDSIPPPATRFREVGKRQCREALGHHVRIRLHTKEGDLHRPPNVVKRWPVPRASISRAAFRAALEAREAALREAAETEAEAAEEQLAETAEAAQGRASLVLSQYLVARTAFFLQAGQALRRQGPPRPQDAGASRASGLGVRRKRGKGAGLGGPKPWVGSGTAPGSCQRAELGRMAGVLEGLTLGVAEERRRRRRRT